MRGSSQQDSTRSGADRGSMVISLLEKDSSRLIGHLSHTRLTTAIRIEYSVCAVNRSEGFRRSVVGISIAVGIRIFNIVGYLGCLGGHFRVFARLQL